MDNRTSDWRKALEFLKVSRWDFKLGIGLIAIGVILVISSRIPILAETFYEAVLLVLNTFTDPTQREFLYDPDQLVAENYWGGDTKADVGSQDLGFLGAVSIFGGVAFIAFHVISNLLLNMLGDRSESGLVDRTGLFDVMGLADKVGLVMVGMGVIFFVLSAVVTEVFGYRGGGLDRSLSIPAAIETLLDMSRIIFVCGVVTMLFGGPQRRDALLGWANRVGWANSDNNQPGVNKLALALIAIGLGVGFVFTHLFLGYAIGVVRTLGIAMTGDWMYLSDLPFWLKAIRVLGYITIGLIPIGIGTIILGFFAGVESSGPGGYSGRGGRRYGSGRGGSRYGGGRGSGRGSRGGRR